MGYDEPFYKDVGNPFPFMDRLGMTSVSNFFERQVTDYQNIGMQPGATMSNVFNDRDF
jgi:ribonucleotide reductase beta subunit family protein with ferritin-like domain